MLLAHARLSNCVAGLSCTCLFAATVAAQQPGQHGAIGGGPGSAGPGSTCEHRYDDGGAEVFSYYQGGGELCWMNLARASGARRVVSISAAWNSIPNGTQARVFVWKDPDDDGNPANAVLLHQQTVTVLNSGSGIVNDYALNTPVLVVGDFYFGASVVHTAGQQPCPVDTTTPYVAGRSWLCGDGQVFNPNILTSNDSPPIDMTLLGGGYPILRACSHPAIEVLYTKIAGHPTAQVPGAKSLSGEPVSTEFRAMEDLIGSTDGLAWVLKSRNQLGSDLETMMLIGTGASGTMLAQEGQPIPDGAAGELFDFFSSGVGRFDSAGRLAYSARARGGDPDTFHKVILWDAGNSTIEFQMGDPITGLQDLSPNPSGDETFGNSVGSIHLLDDGTIGSQDSTIQNIHSSRRPAIMYDNAAFHQTGVTTVLDLAGEVNETWATILANTFYTTPDGAHWTAQGRIVAPATSDTVLVYDDRVVLQEGTEIDGSGVFLADVFKTVLLPNGDWYARGDDPSDKDWAVRNGTLLAKTGDPIFVGSAENWGDTILAFTGDVDKRYVVAGNTNLGNPAADQVIVYNGHAGLVREGDPVDLNGNGLFDDNVYIGRGNNTLTVFDADDMFLSADGYLYFIANLRDGQGNDLNSNPVFGTPHALLRIFAFTPAFCPEDCSGDGQRDQADLALLLSCYQVAACCDVNGDGVTDQADLAALLAEYGVPCP